MGRTRQWEGVACARLDALASPDGERVRRMIRCAGLLAVASLTLTACSQSNFGITAEMRDLPHCESRLEPLVPEDLSTLPPDCDRRGFELILHDDRRLIVGEIGRVREGWTEGEPYGERAYYLINMGTEGVYLAITICAEDTSTTWGTDAAKARFERIWGERVTTSC